MDKTQEFSKRIWDQKYRLKTSDLTPVDKTPDETLLRVAKAISLVEGKNSKVQKKWADKFHQIMSDYRFIPAGRILAGAGSARDVTLFNCFVMGTIPDDIAGIFNQLREAALTMQQGGGIGYDFSTIRPNGALVKGVGADASGPISFMDVWDAMCATIMSAGSRRGAMMACLRCDHPDIEDFITVKSSAERLTNFNLSVLVTDDFMDAVSQGDEWQLSFGGKIYKTIPARDLWDKIMRATYEAAEPGVIFIDRINKRNNLHYCETISATNPCGEQPLPPYGACLLGSLNLAQFIKDPFGDTAHLDMDGLNEVVPIAVRFMDNVIDSSNFPLEMQRQEAFAKRRVGLGVTGLADALIMCKTRYGSADAIRLTENWMTQIRRAAYLASANLAAEKGSFPLYDEAAYLAGETVALMGDEIIAAIKQSGVRNSLLTSIAPTGTISLLAGNVSSGIEPVFSFIHNRKVLLADGERETHAISNYAYRLYRQKFGAEAELPPYFVDAQNLAPDDHLAMQATVQRYIDSAISKTINLPVDTGFDDFKELYTKAYSLGCKGCTTYRPSSIRGAVLTSVDEKQVLPPANLTDENDNRAAEIIYMAEPLDRPGALLGRTYKLQWPESDHAIYITLNDIQVGDHLRPFEVFINSKNMEHYAWTVALTRMISAVFRRGGDVSFVVEELKAVFDPRGGSWLGGKYVPSLLAAIGGIIEKHMVEIGFLVKDDAPLPENEIKKVVGTMLKGQICPKCSMPGLARQEGCDSCPNCGYSKCG